MHIETYTKETMINSLCRYLDVSEENLLGQINKAKKVEEVARDTKSPIFGKYISEYVKQCNTNVNLDKILFFHLSKRLNSAIDDDGLNLRDLLLKKTALSDFLAKHEIMFKENYSYIEIYYKGVLKKLDIDSYDGIANVNRLMRRLGYNQNMQDYCFNGFALKDQLYKSKYRISLCNAPEFLNDLTDFLNAPSISKDYNENSTYYCYEYIVPLSEVIFDGNEKLSKYEKALFLIEKVCSHIYGYNSSYIIDKGNPILRLGDTKTMPKEYLVSKEKIT